MTRLQVAAGTPGIACANRVRHSRQIDETSAVEALSALAQETRLRALRLLIRQGSEGLPAGKVARRLGAPHNTISTHLAILARAGLVASRRESRQVIYAVEAGGVRDLIGFLVEDCCGGRPEACAPLIEAALPLAVCCPGEKRA